MVEMERIRIVPDGEWFHFERKVRHEWLPIRAENGEIIKATSRDAAEWMLGELSKQ